MYFYAHFSGVFSPQINEWKSESYSTFNDGQYILGTDRLDLRDLNCSLLFLQILFLKQDSLLFQSWLGFMVYL